MIPKIELDDKQCYNGNPLLKGVAVNIPYTDEMEDEFLKCMDDPIYFMKTYVKTINADGGDLAPFKPHPYQENLIKSYLNNRFTISLQPRQFGKCVCLNTKVRIRRKSDSQIIELSIGEFYEWQKFRKHAKEVLKVQK